MRVAKGTQLQFTNVRKGAREVGLALTPHCFTMYLSTLGCVCDLLCDTFDPTLAKL